MIVDVLVVIILLASAVIAFLRGFIREVLTIFGIVGGIIAAYIGGPLLVPYVHQWLEIDPNAEEPQKLFDIVPMTIVADILSYGAVLIVFVIILSILSHFISEFARSIGLGALDRTLGVVFGLARGILLLGLLYLPFFYLIDPETKKQWFEGSKTHVYLETTSGWIGSFIPADAKEGLQENAEKLQESNETRQKLEGLLESQEGEEIPALKAEPMETQSQPAEKKDGYSNDFRNQMEKLIEKATEQPQQPTEEQPPQERQ